MMNDPQEFKGVGYVVAFVYSVVVAIFWIPAFVLRRIGGFFREIGAENWPRANGSITAANVNTVHGWIVDYALGELDYSFRVHGEYYAGRITRQYPDEQAAWDFVDAHRDEAVVVRYRDENAKVSVLQAADQGPSWSEAQVGLIRMVWRHWRDVLKREKPPDYDEDNSDDLEPSGAETGARIDRSA